MQVCWGIPVSLQKTIHFDTCCIWRNFIDFLKCLWQHIHNYLGLLVNSANVTEKIFLYVSFKSCKPVVKLIWQLYDSPNCCSGFCRAALSESLLRGGFARSWHFWWVIFLNGLRASHDEPTSLRFVESLVLESAKRLCKVSGGFRVFMRDM